MLPRAAHEANTHTPNAKSWLDHRIYVIPKFISEGIPLIAPDRRTVPLKLISSTKFPDGVVQLHYAVRK